MIRKIEMERFSLTSSKSFDEVVASVNAAIGHPDMAEFGRSTHEARSIDHGAPSRLVTTVKYGIKSIKRIGRITFTDERPQDFWAERGYDWYAGL